MNSALSETERGEDAGLFTSASRGAAIAAALPAFATYFARSQTWSLTDAKDLGSAASGPLDDVAHAIRLRVALAVGQTTVDALQSVLERPSFRFEQASAESIGGLAGRLDVPVYMRGRGRRTSPRTYPVRIIDSDFQLPENVLACALASSLIEILSEAASFNWIRESPELRQVDLLNAQLTRLVGAPVFSSCNQSAVQHLNQGRVSTLVEDAVRRLSRREIQSPEPYERIIEAWKALSFNEFATGDALEWLRYDGRFDPKLFELWILSLLVEAISKALEAEAEVMPLWSRLTSPVATWRLPGVTVNVHYQREFASVGPGQSVWSREDGKFLRGIPDITVEILRQADASSWRMVVDAKLKRHSDSSGDEVVGAEDIYKILGYFEQGFPAPPASGGLIFYAPGSKQMNIYSADQDERSGVLLVLGLDPERDDAADFDALAELVAKAVDLDTGEAAEAKAASIETGADPGEAEAAYFQQLAVDELKRVEKLAPQKDLASFEKVLRGFLGAKWDELDAESRRMLKSAEFFGSFDLEELDHSGPLLGVCAACEREIVSRIWEPARNFCDNELDSRGAPMFDGRATLGTVLRFARDGAKYAAARRDGNDGLASKVLDSHQRPDDKARVKLMADWLDSLDLDLEAFIALVVRLRKLNFDFRIPAAHDRAVSAEKWAAGHQFGVLECLPELLRCLPLD